MSDVVIQEVREMAVKGGFAPVAIAEQLELPITTVYAILHREGIPYSRRGIGNHQTGLTEDQRELFANKYEAGEASLQELCEEYKISKAAAMNILRDFGVEYRGRNKSEVDARDETAVEMYKAGASVADIIVDTGVASPRLYILLRKAGVPLRRKYNA